MVLRESKENPRTAVSPKLLVKILKYSLIKISVIFQKFGQCGFIVILSNVFKRCRRMANSVDPDDTAPQELSDLLPAMVLRDREEKSKDNGQPQLPLKNCKNCSNYPKI